MVLKSKEFILRSYRKGDEKSLVENINDKYIYRYTCNIPYPYTNKIAREWVKKNLELDKLKNGKEINFAIDVDGKVIGGIGFKDIVAKHKAEIGYWLGKKYWNKEIMTEAVKLVTNYGLKKLKLRRITANVFSFNKASARVLEKNNYRLEGKMKNYVLKDKKLIDALLYTKTK